MKKLEVTMVTLAINGREYTVPAVEGSRGFPNGYSYRTVEIPFWAIIGIAKFEVGSGEARGLWYYTIAKQITVDGETPNGFSDNGMKASFPWGREHSFVFEFHVPGRAAYFGC